MKIRDAAATVDVAAKAAVGGADNAIGSGHSQDSVHHD
jgi:hypothetical protein